MGTLPELRPIPTLRTARSTVASERELMLRVGRVPGRRPASVVAMRRRRHQHQWEIVAMEEDSYGCVAMRECRCGLRQFITAA